MSSGYQRPLALNNFHNCISQLHHFTGITSTSIVDRGRNVLSASRDGTARLWDVGTQQCLATYAPEAGVVNQCCQGVVHEAIGLGQPEEAPGMRK